MPTDLQTPDTETPRAKTPEESVTPTTSVEDRMVPVSEAIRYRKRAQAAEQQIESIRNEFNQLKESYEQSQEIVHDLERRQRIDALLGESEVIDLEAARLLTEVTVRSMDEPDVAQAVEDLRRHKPYLFRQVGGEAASVLSPELENDIPDDLTQAARHAQTSGDRRDLLRYLRLRRRG